MGVLRTVFALSVVFAHSSWNDGFVFVGGQNAVELFYVISGFLISYVIHTNESYRNPLKFYVSRWLRIYPIYYAVATLSLVALLLGNRQIFKLYEEFPGSADIMLVVSQVLLLGQDWMCFLGVQNGHLAFLSDLRPNELQIHNGLLVPQAWTLGLEVSFYAMAPFILRNRPALYILLILSLLLKAALVMDGIGRQDPWTYRFFPAELGLFLLGALSHFGDKG
jgi:peptidoglycan/LPS O-acetylase OafA/YrhL